MDGEDRTGRERKKRLRARRDEAGMAQVSGWVPKERRPYAREVLAALARGANSLPSDPEQAAALEAAQADAAAARIAERAVRAEAEAAREAGNQAVDAAMARAETAERAREIIAGELWQAKIAVAQAHAEAERFQKLPGLRGRVIRWFVLRL